MENKTGLFFALLLSIGFMGQVQAAGPGTAKEVIVAVSAANVSDNQSTRDDAVVFASGMFPNSCYTWSRADVRNVTDFDHEIKSYGWVDQSGPCLMYLKPFNEKINLGKLAAGVHRLRFLSHDDTFLEARLVVR